MRVAYLGLFLMLAIRQAPAQIDTITYDGMWNVNEGQLLAVTTFPGELDVVFNTRFSPLKPCILEGVILGLGLVKFTPVPTTDTLIVYVYEHTAVPPTLTNLGKTYKMPLGKNGIPTGNRNITNPLSSAYRDQVYVRLDPPVVFSPKRDFLIGVKVLSDQQMDVGSGKWNGFTVVLKKQQSEYDRYRRYRISDIPGQTRNELATQTGQKYSMFMRAVVRYDTTLPAIDPTPVERTPRPESLQLHSWPNPFTASMLLEYSLPSRGYVRLELYDSIGRPVGTVAEGLREAGKYTHSYSATEHGLSPGMYYFRFVANGVATVRPVLLLR